MRKRQDKEADVAETLALIGAKLDTIIRLLAAETAARVAASDGKQVEQIEALGPLGLDRTTIAEVLGTTANTVGVALSRASIGRKSKSKSRTKRDRSGGRR